MAMKSIFDAKRRAPKALAVLLAAGLVAGCGSNAFEYSYPESTGDEREPARYSNQKSDDTVFGNSDGFFGLFGGDDDKNDGSGGGGIGVNSFLWRASLDTISFMPLSSADPFGGVIITDWYSPPEAPNERFKMNVYILGRQLRADGVRVAVFRQAQNGGGWQDASVQSGTAVNLENQILTRARQLRVASTAE